MAERRRARGIGLDLGAEMMVNAAAKERVREANSEHDWTFVGVADPRPMAGEVALDKYRGAGYAVAICKECGATRWTEIGVPGIGEVRIALAGPCDARKVALGEQ